LRANDSLPCDLTIQRSEAYDQFIDWVGPPKEEDNRLPPLDADQVERVLKVFLGLEGETLLQMASETIQTMQMFPEEGSVQISFCEFVATKLKSRGLLTDAIVKTIDAEIDSENKQKMVFERNEVFDFMQLPFEQGLLMNRPVPSHSS
jgi:hypothetical protein